MTPALANLINAIVLIAMSLWGYLGSETPSPTALIPAGFGIIFLALTPGLRKNNKVIAHIVVLLTLLLIIALFRPFTSALDRGDTMAAVRVGIMFLTSFLAMITFIRSFIQARRNKG